MRLMAIDCEMNQPSNKVIQVGAVVFDPSNGDVIDTLRLYVNPGEDLNPEIISFTRITQSLVDNGMPVKDAYLKLKEWAAGHGVFCNPVVWGSGESNDSLILYTQADIKEDNFMGHRVIDIKTVCQVRSIMIKGDVGGGLAAYLGRIGRGWDITHGEPHDALADAYNTMSAFIGYSMFLIGWTHLERFHTQLKKGPGTGKWRGIIQKLSFDIAHQITILGRLQERKSALENEP